MATCFPEPEAAVREPDNAGSAMQRAEQVRARKRYAHVPHPHIEKRKKFAPEAPLELPEHLGPVARFNALLAVKITKAVGTMWCAYAFAGLALLSLPEAMRGGMPALVSWTAQTFLQLVLLSIIIVGQKVASLSSEKRANETYNDAEAILHESVEIQKHLTEQDEFLQRLIDELVEARSARGANELRGTETGGQGGHRLDASRD